jgi:hypothetical protein
MRVEETQPGEKVGPLRTRHRFLLPASIARQRRHAHVLRRRILVAENLIGVEVRVVKGELRWWCSFGLGNLLQLVADPSQQVFAPRNVRIGFHT